LASEAFANGFDTSTKTTISKKNKDEKRVTKIKSKTKKANTTLLNNAKSKTKQDEDKRETQ